MGEMLVNAFDVSKFAGFIYDGCHKLYLFRKDEKKTADGFFNETCYDLNELPKRFIRSCGLRFIQLFDLSKTVVAQFEKTVVFRGFNTNGIDCGRNAAGDLIVSKRDGALVVKRLDN